MRAAYIEKYGKSEKLKIGERPNPELLDSDILVKIYSASLNPIDFKIRNGILKFLRKFNFPFILGHDLAGVVVGIGKNVKKFNVGDKVFSRPRYDRIGTLAELIAINEDDVSIMPNNLSFSEAASLPLVALTSWQALIDIAKVKSRDRVFIQAGSGGIGTFAIQLAKHLGAYVITTTSQKNIGFVKSLGADEVIDYNQQNFYEVLKDIDVVFDTLGGNALYSSFKIIRPQGWIISISGDPDGITARDMNLRFMKSLVLKFIGRKVNRLARQAKANYRFLFMKPSGQQLSEIKNLVEQGRIKPVVDKEFTLENSQAAIEYLESGRARGKVVVRIQS